MEQAALSMKELQREIGYSPAWVRRMERLKLIKPLTPKHQGAKRLYSKGNVVNCLRLMALSVCGFRPERVQYYAERVEHFNKLTEPFLKKERPQYIDGAVLLFDLRDIYPDGDPNNIKWRDLENAITRKDGIYKFYRKEFDVGELLAEALGELFEIAQVALEARTKIKNTQRALQTAEGIGKGITEEFLPGVTSLLFSPEEYKIGIVGRRVASSLGNYLKILEGKE